MCRLVAYLGQPVRLAGLLTETEHGLVHQSWAPRQMATATMNADGIGIGWFDDTLTAATYRSVLPAWADVNLEPLGRSLCRGQWMAAVRSATSGFDTGVANTQPFTAGGLMFLHNGFIEGFNTSLRARIRAWLTPDIEADIHGTTDSEYLFAVLRQHHRVEGCSLAEALRRTLSLAETADAPSLLNLVVSDGRQLVAARHALHADCPSLYLCREPRWLGSDGTVIASEPLTEEALWTRVPEHTLITLNGASGAREEAL